MIMAMSLMVMIILIIVITNDSHHQFMTITIHNIHNDINSDGDDNNK